MLLTLIFVGVFTYAIWHILLRPSPQYWKKFGIYQVSDIGSVVEHFKILIGKDGMTLADLDERAYHQAPESEKVVGIFENAEYGTPVLVVKDLEMVKAVMIKDFDHFVDRRGFPDPDKHSVLNRVLFNLKGDEWKGVRSSVSPTFTTGKIRRMNAVVNKVCLDWVAHFQEKIKQNGGSHTFTAIEETTHYTVDAIAAAVFGMDAGAIRNPKSGFAHHAMKITENSAMQLLKFAVSTMFPKTAAFFKVNLFPKESMDYFVQAMFQGLTPRLEGKIKGNDFLQILAEARKGELKAVGSDELSAFEKDAELKDHGTSKKNWLDNDEIIQAQLIQFFIAGFSTTANVLGFVFYALALNPDVQDKLREEVNKKLFPNGDTAEIDYDELNKLVYLDMVESETLRKFPVLNRHERICTRNYHNKEFNIEIKKDTVVSIPVQAIHNDRKFYEKPDEFYPEHFSPEKKAERSPYAYLPFGHGPRNCIGMRFALVNSKAAIAHIVHNFKIVPAASTPKTLLCQGGRIGVQMLDHLELKMVPINK